MARRRRCVAGALMLTLALLLTASPGEAQNPPGRDRQAPRLAQPNPPAPPAVRGAPSLPNYYLERGGPVTAPKGPVGPNGIAQSLQARGFRDIGPVQQRGNTTIVPHATGPSGEKVQLIIGPNGDILGVRVLRQGNR